MAGIGGFVITLLWAVAAVAWIRRLGPRVLAAVRWSRVPLIGRTSGIVASLILVAASFLVAVAANAIDPRPLSAAQLGTATPVTRQSSAAPNSSTKPESSPAAAIST